MFDMLATADSDPGSSTVVGAVIGIVSTISIIVVVLIVVFLVR